MTTDSNSHLVAPAVLTEHPVVQEDDHRRLSQAEQRAFELASEKNEKQPEQRCLACTWNLAFLSSKNGRLCAKKARTQTHHHYSQKNSTAALVKKVRDKDYVQLLLEFFMNQAHVFNLTSSSGSIHVLGTIMVVAGSRAASVTIHRVVDTEHGLGNVTAEIMLKNIAESQGQVPLQAKHCQNLSRRNFSIRWFDVVLLPRVSVLTLILGDASWKSGVLGKTLDTIKQSAICVARRTLDSGTVQEIFDECTTAHNYPHRNRGFSPVAVGKDAGRQVGLRQS